MKIEEDIYGEIYYKKKWLIKAQIMWLLLFPIGLTIYLYIIVRDYKEMKKLNESFTHL